MTIVASFHIGEFKKIDILPRLLVVGAERWEIINEPGIILGKVLGTGRGLSTKTSIDLSRWAIFAIWNNEQDRKNFIDSSELINRWRTQSKQLTHYELLPLRCHGKWGGIEPLKNINFKAIDPNKDKHPIAVLTRANIKVKKLPAFIKEAKKVDASLQQHPGRQFSIGIGEWPILQQATFSVWNNPKDMYNFAYTLSPHKDAMKKANKNDWFSEELFARFAITSHFTE